MSRSSDPGWDEFERELQGTAPRDLAARLGIEPRLVTEWKAGRRRPLFADIPRISAALTPDGDTTYLAARMGLVPSPAKARDVLDAGLEVLYLRAEAAELAAQLDRSPRDSAARIVDAVVSHGGWAVAVWPAFEGPGSCKIHVADRLDFLRTDGGPVSESALRADFGDLLDQLGAVRSRPSVRPRMMSADDPRTVERWSVVRFAENHPPSRSFALSVERSVAVISTSLQAWPTDTAAVIAKILGYGLISTRWLATRTAESGRAVPDSPEHRLELHREMLKDAPRHYVWYHYGRGTGSQSLIPDPENWSPTLKIVRLRESDRILEYDARIKGDGRLEELVQARDDLDAQLADIPDNRVVTFPVDLLGDEPVTDPEHAHIRNLRFEQALTVADQAVKWLRHNSSATSLDLDAVTSDSDRKLILQWLRDRS